MSFAVAQWLKARLPSTATRAPGERIGRLLLMHANSREDIDVARTGDIVAVAGLKNIITGETLCDEKAPIILERMDVSLSNKLSSSSRILSHRCSQTGSCLLVANLKLVFKSQSYIAYVIR